MPKAEWVDLVDLNNQVVGRALRSEVRSRNLLHRGIAVLVRNSQGQVYVHQRTDCKDVFPSMYDMFVGGVVGSGEEYWPAALREVREELGVESERLKFLFDHLYHGPLNFSWVRCYEVVWDGPIQHQPEEVQWGQWLDADQLDPWIERHEIVPDGLSVYQAYREFCQRPALDINNYAAIIFDMDGILIDSEPFWRQAEMELFATVGVHLTEADCVETMGIRIDEVVALRAPHADQARLAQAMVDRVIELVKERGKALPGSRETLERIQHLGIPCGLATSSGYDLLNATLETLGFRDFFQIVHSAQDEVLGKPHPSVYLEAAKKLGVAPQHCLAIEDSVNGLVSAKAARMDVVAIPEAQFRRDRRFGLANWQFDTLFDFSNQMPDRYQRN